MGTPTLDQAIASVEDLVLHLDVGALGSCTDQRPVAGQPLNCVRRQSYPRDTDKMCDGCAAYIYAVRLGIALRCLKTAASATEAKAEGR